MAEIYRFLGTEAVVGNTRLDTFGAAISLSKELAMQAILAGVPLLQESEFKAIGFKPEDLKIWASPFQNDFDIPAEEADQIAKANFIKLKNQGLERCMDNRSALRLKLAEEVKVAAEAKVANKPMPGKPAGEKKETN